MAGTATTAEDVMRGVAGGAILGVPLLYTQETWLHGRSVPPVVILAGVIATFGVNVALSYFVGFRPGRTHRPIEDAVVGTGISILLSAILLVLLDRLGSGTSPENAFGVIALTSIPVSIGFAVGSALAPSQGAEASESFTGWRGDLLIAAGGALVFALNIAPTAEPVILAAQLNGVHLSLLVVASLVLPYLMVFYAEFGGRRSAHRERRRDARTGHGDAPRVRRGVRGLRRDARDVRARRRREPGGARTDRRPGLPGGDRGGARADAHMTATKNRGVGRERTPFEWALLLISMAAALALAVGLAISGLTGTRGPADLEIDITATADPASGGRPLELTVTNVGGTSAENVVVEVTVGDVVREVTLALVAKGDEESATVIVPAAATASPRAEVLSYSDP